MIFLPLNFVTSYLGMNTYDMNNMSNKQSLFWAIVVQLTCTAMAVILSIAYNGDQLRWLVSNGFHVLMRYEYLLRTLNGQLIILSDLIPTADPPQPNTRDLSLRFSLCYHRPYAWP